MLLPPDRGEVGRGVRRPAAPSDHRPPQRRAKRRLAVDIPGPCFAEWANVPRCYSEIMTEVCMVCKRKMTFSVNFL